MNFFKDLFQKTKKLICKCGNFCKTLWADKRRRSRLIYWTLIGLLAAIFVLSAVMIGLHYYEAQKSAGQFEELVELTKQETQKVLTPAERYAPILEQNDDFVGWIEIDGTVIDYPVVQTPDDPDYYLRRGIDKQYSYYGVPYAAANCDVDNSDNVVIYGHNMKNGTMFSDLENYTDPAFYASHKTIRFDTLRSFGTYEIIAVFKTTADGDFAYHTFAGGTEEEFNEYVSRCKELALYDTGSTAVYGDKLLTLSTCEYSAANGRFVVVAKKIA